MHHSINRMGHAWHIKACILESQTKVKGKLSHEDGDLFEIGWEWLQFVWGPFEDVGSYVLVDKDWSEGASLL